MATIECPRCGAANGPTASRCYRCNAHLPVTLAVGAGARPAAKRDNDTSAAKPSQPSAEPKPQGARAARKSRPVTPPPTSTTDYRQEAGGSTMFHSAIGDVPFNLDPDSGDVFTSAETGFDQPSVRDSRRLSYGGGKMVDATGADPADLISGRHEVQRRDEGVDGKDGETKRRHRDQIAPVDKSEKVNAPDAPSRVSSGGSAVVSVRSVRREGRADPPRDAPPVLGPVTYVPGKGIVPRGNGQTVSAEEETRIVAAMEEGELSADHVELDRRPTTEASTSGEVPATGEGPSPAATTGPDSDDAPTLVGKRPTRRNDQGLSEVAELGASFGTGSSPRVRSRQAPREEFPDDMTSIGAPPGKKPRESITIEALDLEGNAARAVPLQRGRCLIGTGPDCDLMLRSDPTVSDYHAQLLVHDDGVHVSDLASLNGVYVNVTSKVVLKDGDAFIGGQQHFVFRNRWDEPAVDRDGTVVAGSRGYDDATRVLLMREGGQVAGIYFVTNALIVGRSRGDIVFGDDVSMSTEQLAIRRTGDDCVLFDLESAQGTFLRIRERTKLLDGDVFQLGRTRFRLVL